MSKYPIVASKVFGDNGAKPLYSQVNENLCLSPVFPAEKFIKYIVLKHIENIRSTDELT